MTPDPAAFALGVDLGTTNTVAVVRWPDGRSRPLLFDGAPLLPSGVLLDERGGLHVGRDAQRLAQVDPGRYEPNPKRRVDDTAVLLGDREVPVVDLFAAALDRVARAAVEAVGFLPPAVLTHPASWGQRRRERLTEAARRAGWPPVRLVPEPVAAARYFSDVLRRPVPVGACLGVFDFGGGTLDVAVVRNEGGHFAVLGSGGLEDLGGLDLDAALVDRLAATLVGVAPRLWDGLNRPVTAAQRRDRRLFWQDVCGAKEMLSRTAVAPIPVPGLDGALHLTREELEQAAAPLVRRGVAETAAVVARCGLRPDQLAGLFLVGGSSRVPLVARLLHAELGVAPTVLEQPELPVAEGALAELAPPSTGRLPVPAGTSPVSGPPTTAVPGVPAPAAPVSGAPAPPPGTAVPARRPLTRRPEFWTAVTAAVAVLALAATAAVVYFRGEREVPFGTLERVGGVAAGDRPTRAFTRILGDRAYVAWQQDEKLEVAAVELATGRQRWRRTVPGTAKEWRGITATPGAIVAFAEDYRTAEPRAVQVLDPDSGERRWETRVYGDDELFLFGSRFVVSSDQDKRMRGLDLRTGAEKWSLDHPRAEGGATATAVLGVSTAEGTRGPAGFVGATGHGPPGDDRLVQIGSDEKLRVIDAVTGKVTGSRPNVGRPTGRYLAHEDRVYAVGGTPYEVRSFDLTALGEPQTVYTAPEARRGLQAIGPCGADRICVLDGTGGDVQVAAVDVQARRQLWRRGAAKAETVVPVGDGVLAVGDSAPASFLFDGDGRQLLKGEDQARYAVRVNGRSLLVFGAAPASYPTDASLTGVTTSGGRVSLGTVEKARGAACSWSEEYLVCPTDKEFGVWRFTGG